MRLARVRTFSPISRAASPTSIAIVTNPPFGMQGRLAEAFIAHALELVPFVAMLLRVDFDSAKSRQHLFRHNPYFAGKLVLLNRVKFFDGPSSPSDNHSWFLFDRGHSGPPIIRYASNTDLQLDLPASSRWLPARGRNAIADAFIRARWPFAGFGVHRH